MKFAAGHFTIFSSNRRERIHGHNFTVSCTISSNVKQNDLMFDYANYKNILADKCQKLDELMLLPSKSSYLLLNQTDKSVHCNFNNEEMVFPLSDVYIMPIDNITIEGLAEWFLLFFIDTILPDDIKNISEIEMSVSSSPAQFGIALWRRMP